MAHPTATAGPLARVARPMDSELVRLAAVSLSIADRATLELVKREHAPTMLPWHALETEENRFERLANVGRSERLGQNHPLERLGR